MSEWGIVNPLMMAVALMQVFAGVYGFATSAPKAAAIMILVGLANAIMSTIRA